MKFEDPIDQQLFDLLDEKDYTRPELVAITGIPRTTIHDHLTKLWEQGLLKKYVADRKVQGRPKIYFRRIR